MLGPATLFHKVKHENKGISSWVGCGILVKEGSLGWFQLPGLSRAQATGYYLRLDGEGVPSEARIWSRATGVARLMHVESGRLVHIQAEVSSKQSGYRLLGLIRDSWRGGAATVFQSLSRVRHFAIPWTVTHQASWSFTISWSLLKLTSIELVMPSNHLVLYHPLLLICILKKYA